ncbi:MAG: PD-(D/E)XK nuclease family protein [Halobacteriota archaeon]|nr:PD-(D/E)XK nuclease family protein [Halobacteriota archaeon]
MPTYSYSRINTFENCPLQFKYRYIDKIKTESEGIEAFMGTIVHESLEKLYSDCMRSKETTLDDLIDFFISRWNKGWHDGIEIVRKGHTPDNYKETGKKCIEQYYTRYTPFDKERTIALEKKVEITLGEFKMIGFIDRLTQRQDGTYEIRDYKTSSSLPEQKKVDKDAQLALYQLALRDMWDDVYDVDLVWHYLTFDKELRSRRDEQSLEDLVCEYVSKIRRIESATEFEPKESALCNWCGYQGMCPKRRHMYKVESLSPGEFKRDDGVRLVNSYVEVNNRLKEIQSERERLREDIFSYARQKGVEAIVGSDSKLRARMSSKPRYPSKSSDEVKYRRLVSLIKSSGRWEDVSKLDPSALARIIEECGWDEELIEEIKEEYQEIVEERRIWVSKLKDREE